MLVGSLIRPPDQTYDTYMYLIQTKNEINTITMKHQTDIYQILTDLTEQTKQAIFYQDQTKVLGDYSGPCNETNYRFRKDNTVDLIITSHRAFILRCKPLPSVGNNDKGIALLEYESK